MALYLGTDKVAIEGRTSGNIISGTFTTSNTAGAYSITLDYIGVGYPIAVMVYIDGGAYNTSIDNWYNSVQRYAVGSWSMTKSNTTLTPTYTTSGAANQGVTQWIYKNSTTTATTYSRSSAMTTNSYSSSNATGAGATCIRLTGNTSLSYYVNTTSYGLLPDTKYAYIVIYSC